MRPPVRLRIAVSVIAVALTAACGSDSTGPSQAPSDLARHFDSISVAAAAKADTFSAYSGRALLTSFIEIPAAYGATPSSVDVTTENGVEHWKAYEILSLPHSSTDSQYVLLAYRDSDAHTILLAYFDSTGSITDGAVVTNDTLSLDITDGGGSSSLTSASGACGTPSASLQNQLVLSLGVSSCTLAKFRSSVGFTSTIPTGADPALATLQISMSTISGIRAVDAEDPASIHTLNRIRARLHGMIRSKPL
jgi:hypothetical protein